MQQRQCLSESLKLIRQRTRSGWPRNGTERNGTERVEQPNDRRVIYSRRPISRFRYPSAAIHPLVLDLLARVSLVTRAVVKQHVPRCVTARSNEKEKNCVTVEPVNKNGITRFHIYRHHMSRHIMKYLMFLSK